MTKDEWIERCSARYQERGGLTPEQAQSAAEACFDAESGESEFGFSESVEYCPEDCADEDMSNWQSKGKLEAALETAMMVLDQIATTPRNRGARRSASAALIFLRTQLDAQDNAFAQAGEKVDISGTAK